MQLTFVLDEQMAQRMVDLIANGPYKDAAPILNELQRQANEQRMAMPRQDAPREVTLNRHGRRAAQSASGPKGEDAQAPNGG